MVTLASTTSSQEELEHAASENWREPFEPKPEERKETPEGKQPETAAAQEPAEKEESKKPQEHKSGWQKRIDKLTAKNYKLSNEIEELRSKIKPAETTAPAQPQEPKLADFGGDVEKFLSARDAFKEKTETQAAEQERLKATYDTYNRKVSEARGNYEDWDEVLEATDITIPQSAGLAVIESDNGPDVAYYLATHPEEAEALNGMTPIGMVRSIAKISDTLAAKPAPTEKPKAKPAEPISPVGASSTRSSVPLDQLSPKEYIKIRNKQERENRGR